MSPSSTNVADFAYVGQGSDLTEGGLAIFGDLYEEFLKLEDRIEFYTKKLTLIAREDENCRKLMSIPGIKEITATALVSSVGDFHSFKNGRGLSAWIGLVPRHKASGQRKTLLGISKRGDSCLRRFLVHGASAVVSQCRDKTDHTRLWIRGCLSRRGFNKTVITLANKNARIPWAVIVKGLDYNATHIHGY